jgi:hypothetical protein
MKLDMYPRAKQALTEDAIFQNTVAIINDGLNWPGKGEEIFSLHISIAEFKKMKGFHGSFLMMKQLVIGYPARLLRMYAMRVDPDITQNIPDIIAELDPIEDKVTARLMVHFEEKFGKVDQARIKEIDEIAASWELQDQQQLQDLIQGKGWKAETKE